MELDPQTAAVIIAVAGAVTAVLRFLDRRDHERQIERLELHMSASAERSRRRDARDRRRRESMQHTPIRRRESQPAAESWDDEVTDMHELVELERAARVKRDTDRQQRNRGERPPRPGAHHDRTEE